MARLLLMSNEQDPIWEASGFNMSANELPVRLR